MIRAVIDTNVLASGIAKSGASPRVVMDRWSERTFDLVLSEHILQELARTLARPYFRTYVSSSQAAWAIDWIRSRASFTEIIEQVAGIATHPEDDQVLATAVSGSADFIVTGDRQLLKLREFEGIRIVTAAEFLLVLADSSYE